MNIDTFEDWIEKHNLSQENIDISVHKKYIKDVFEPVYPWFPNNSWKFMQNTLYETLLKSYDKEKLKQKIHDSFSENIFDFGYDSNVSPKMLVIKYEYNYEFTKTYKFKQLLNLFNYTLTFIDPDDRLIYLEPNIPDEMSNYVYEHCNGIIWHITKKNKISFDNIMKYGLKPKTVSYRNYSERVFFITGSTKDEIYKNILKTKKTSFLFQKITKNLF